MGRPVATSASIAVTARSWSRVSRNGSEARQGPTSESLAWSSAATSDSSRARFRDTYSSSSTSSSSKASRRRASSVSASSSGKWTASSAAARSGRPSRARSLLGSASTDSRSSSRARLTSSRSLSEVTPSVAGYTGVRPSARTSAAVTPGATS